MTRRAAIAAASLVLAWLGAACAGEGPESYRPLLAGDTAPAYGAVSLAGDSVDLSDFRGTPVVLNLWATWCVPCREEMPELQELHEAYGDQLTVVGVSIDHGQAGEEISSFLEEVGVGFLILHDPTERVTRRFTTVGVPETFLIGADGVVLKRWVGRFSPMAEENRAIVEGAVAAAPRSLPPGDPLP